MDVIMKTGLCGPDISLTRGDTHTCEDFEAVRLVRSGLASATDTEAFAAAAAAFDAAEAEKAAAAEQAKDDAGDAADESDGVDDAEKAGNDAPATPNDAVVTEKPKPAARTAKAKA